MSDDVQIPATETIVAPEVTDTPLVTEEVEQEAVATKTYTEEEVKAREDALAAKMRNKFERKEEKSRIEKETRQQIEAESKKATESVKKLSPNDFDTWELYNDAVLDQKVEARLQKRENETQQQQQERTAKQEVERVENLSQSMIEKGNEKYGDMEDIIEGIKDNLISNKTGFSDAGRMAILESDISADILHHLNKNPTEAIRIANLSNYAQAKEIGKLELSLEKPKPITKAPAPISPIEGEKSFSKSMEKASPAEYQAMRRKQGARWA